MRGVISVRRSLLVVVLCAIPTIGQQSTTDTNCTAYGSQINCTSNTTSTGSTDAQRAEQQREMNEAGKAIGSAAGTIIANKILKKRVSKWCGEHPEGSWNFSSGQNVTCWNWNEEYQPAANAQLRAQRTDQAMTIAVASHAFCKAHPDQSWTGPISGKVTPCGQLLTLQDVECSRSPEQAVCKAIADSNAPTPAAVASPAHESASLTALPVSASPTVPSPSASAPAVSVATQTPLTAEQKDALSYCQRNPSATITWSNGTVSPCSSVLTPR